MMSPYFSYLRGKYGKQDSGGLTRREALRLSLAAGTGMLLSSSLGCLVDSKSREGAPRPVEVNGNGRRVLIVGGGFAGLAAAYELLASGYDVTVLEARNRPGGRVLSFSDLIEGKNAEGGAELIGSNHPLWVAYADRFKLAFLDVSKEDRDQHGAACSAPFLLDGRRLNEAEEEELWAAVEGEQGLTSLMNADARAVDAERPWNTPDASRLDATSVAAWIAAQPGSELAKRAVDALLTNDNGQPTSRQSYLGMLASIKGGGVDRYWSDSEVYRCEGGNQQLAYHLMASVGPARVKLGAPVTAITVGDTQSSITAADGSTYEAEDVILAVPPSVWGKIRIEPGLPPALAPQMGSNVKYLSVMKSRFWLQQGLSQYSLSDGPLGWTWDPTDNQKQVTTAGITAFSGGPSAEVCRSWSAAERDAKYLAEYEQRWPGATNQFVTSRFMDWPSDPWTQAGYSFPAPGQVTTVGPILHDGLGRLHFAGEHCCYAFVGYMEGALQSGALLARRIAQRDGVAQV